MTRFYSPPELVELDVNDLLAMPLGCFASLLVAHPDVRDVPAFHRVLMAGVEQTQATTQGTTLLKAIATAGAPRLLLAAVASAIVSNKPIHSVEALALRLAVPKRKLQRQWRETFDYLDLLDCLHLILLIRFVEAEGTCKQRCTSIGSDIRTVRKASRYLLDLELKALIKRDLGFVEIRELFDSPIAEERERERERDPKLD
jgi:hypothetical protein